MLSLGVAAFIAWRLYLRTARLFRRQPLSPRRSWTVLGLFSPIVIFLVLGSLANSGRALALVAGIAVGAALGNYGLRLTRLEQTPSGLFYTPNAYLGVGLSLLFVGRLTYRAVQLYSSGASADWSQFAGTPLTLLIFGMLAAYYIAYAIGLLRWRSRVARL